MRPSFRNFHRAPCWTLSTVGRGKGGCIGTMKLELSGEEAVVDGSLFGSVSDILVETAGITSIHLGRVDQQCQFPLQRTPLVRQPGSTACVIMVEGAFRT